MAPKIVVRDSLIAEIFNTTPRNRVTSKNDNGNLILRARALARKLFSCIAIVAARAAIVATVCDVRKAQLIAL